MDELNIHIDNRLQKIFPSMNNHTRQQCIKRIIRRDTDNPIDDPLIERVVVAYVRHNKTRYDDFCDDGMDINEARNKIKPIVSKWMKTYRRKRAPWLAKNF